MIQFSCNVKIATESGNTNLMINFPVLQNKNNCVNYVKLVKSHTELFYLIKRIDTRIQVIQISKFTIKNSINVCEMAPQIASSKLGHSYRNGLSDIMEVMSPAPTMEII